MNSSYVPEGYSTICPYLVVRSVEDQINFLVKVFGGEIKDSVKDNEGFIMHGEVKIGNTTIMMGRANEKWPSTEGMNYVFVENADNTYRKALESGAVSLMEPDNRFYGFREGGFKDKHGNTWWVAHEVEKVSPEEMDRRLKQMNQNG